jgi:hypothetical protein
MMAAYRILIGKSEGKKPLGRPKHKLEGSIKISSVRRCALNWSDQEQGLAADALITIVNYMI